MPIFLNWVFSGCTHFSISGKTKAQPNLTKTELLWLSFSPVFEYNYLGFEERERERERERESEVTCAANDKYGLLVKRWWLFICFFVSLFVFFIVFFVFLKI